MVVYNPNSGKYNKEDTLPKVKKILEEYNETLAEISSFGDFKWLFDAVMNYQSEHLGLPKPQYNFEFELHDQVSYKKQ